MNFVKKYRVLIVLIVGLLLISALFYEHSWWKGQNDHGWEHAHYVLLVIGTILIAWVAWWQLDAMKKIGQNDFLLRIDDRYGGAEIVKARTIIHELYVQTKDEKGEISNDKHIEKIANEIKEMGGSRDKKVTEKFIYLLNFLDFLETIAYFTNQNSLSIDDIQELFGGSVTYYYKIFKSWIYYRRDKYEDSTYYSALEKLVKKIESEKLASKINRTHYVWKRWFLQ